MPLPGNASKSLPFAPGDVWFTNQGWGRQGSYSHFGYAAFSWDFIIADHPSGNTYPNGTMQAPVHAACSRRGRACLRSATPCGGGSRQLGSPSRLGRSRSWLLSSSAKLGGRIAWPNCNRGTADCAGELVPVERPSSSGRCERLTGGGRLSDRTACNRQLRGSAKQRNLAASFAGDSAAGRSRAPVVIALSMRSTLQAKAASSFKGLSIMSSVDPVMGLRSLNEHRRPDIGRR